MNAPGNDLLLLSGKVVTILLQAAMAVGALALAIAVPALIFFEDAVLEGVRAGSPMPLGEIPMLPLIGLLGIMFITLAALFVFFGKLRAIIDTVSAGDPFVPVNAERLSAMAWLLLASQLLTWPLVALALVIAEWAQELDDVDLRLEGDAFDITGILMVLVLFILARVFRHGAAMREDLEGTV